MRRIRLMVLAVAFVSLTPSAVFSDERVAGHRRHPTASIGDDRYGYVEWGSIEPSFAKLQVERKSLKQSRMDIYKSSTVGKAKERQLITKEKFEVRRDHPEMVLPGKYQVTVCADGYESFEREVNVEPTKTVRVDAVLRKRCSKIRKMGSELVPNTLRLGCHGRSAIR